MNRRVAFLLLLIAATACKRAPEPPPPQPAQQKQPAADEARPITEPIRDIDGDNLLNVAYGAAVVSRTAELNLEASAMHAIDGMSMTTWSSPPGGPAQTLVFAFGGPSRVEQLGVTTLKQDQAPEQVLFSASSDGRSWREIATVKPLDRGTQQIEVPPFEARYLRVETVEPKEQYAALASVHAIGREIAAPERHSFGGCWDVNTRRAAFTQSGTRITGVITGTKFPTFVDGGLEGRVAKLMWMRGPMWGYAVATLTPDGNGISAITFHEEPIFNQVGEAWIGRRCDDGASGVAPIAPADYLRRTGRWMISGDIDAAAALIRSEPSQRFRVIAREFRENDPAVNLRTTDARIDAMRTALRARGVDVTHVQFVSDGSKRTDADTPSAVQRMLWSRTDLEAVERRRPAG